ncbi:MAG: SHOCT domain-containing protein [Ilumatobacteraceae bacterium]
MLANIGLGELLWSLLVIYLMVMYFVIVFTVVFDVFRSQDLSGGKKALWAFALLFFPIVSMLAYLIVRGAGMGERSQAAAKAAKDDTDAYIRSVATPAGGVASELEKAKVLLDSGAITADDYAALKAKILA